jgi:hypothetical protein
MKQMNSRQQAALSAFHRGIKELKASGVIRSHRYLGDIAEFLCARAFGIDLATNQREAGHDGLRETVKVQIKFGGGKKTNMDLGDPDAYEELYVVLGRESVVRHSGYDGDYLVYKLTADEVRGMQVKSGKYSCGTTRFSGKPNLVISLEDLATVGSEAGTQSANNEPCSN